MNNNFEYDIWNEVKKSVNQRIGSLYFKEGEVWWCYLGLNIGVEINGKDKKYFRPVLVIKKFNKYMAWVIPLSTKIRNDDFHINANFNSKIVSFKITQIKTMSNKRFDRVIGTVSADLLLKIKQKAIYFLK